MLTHQQKFTLAKVVKAHLKGQRYRAADSGERVTLASLYRQVLLVRWAWRGQEGEPSAAYEYALHPDVETELKRTLAAPT